MKTTMKTQAQLEPTVTANTDLSPGPSTVEAARALAVIYGPSLVLDLLAAASIGILARSALGGRTACRAARLLRPLAGLGVGLTAAYLLAVRPRLRRWGATDDEMRRTLPGDELVPDPAISATWAVTIDAPVREVWEWLAQIGQDRGGFYSYAWLENLAGCKLRNADRVHPEWQHRTVGELVKLHPAVGLKAAYFEPERALVLDGWGAFVLEPIDNQTTRLISRSRVPRGRAALSYALLMEIPHFVMQREMLLGIKRRAERAAKATRVGRDTEARATEPDARDDLSSEGCHRKGTLGDTSRPRPAVMRVERETLTPDPQRADEPTSEPPLACLSHTLG
jgi:hypothetical protein